MIQKYLRIPIDPSKREIELNKFFGFLFFLIHAFMLTQILLAHGWVDINACTK